MAGMGLAMIDKEIMEFLRLGGMIESATGTGLIAKFISKALSDAEIKKIATASDIDATTLTLMYSHMLRKLMPDPTIKSGGPLLVPTLVFMEPFRLQEILDIGWRPTASRSIAERRGMLLEKATRVAGVIYTAHLEGRGPSGFSISATGSPEYAERTMLAQQSGAVALRWIGVLVAGLIAFALFK